MPLGVSDFGVFDLRGVVPLVGIRRPVTLNMMPSLDNVFFLCTGTPPEVYHLFTYHFKNIDSLIYLAVPGLSCCM